MTTNATHWLISFDGSEHSVRALDLAIREAKERSERPRLYVLNVQTPLSSDITRFIDRSAIDDFHREAGESILAPAKAILNTCGTECSVHILVGNVAQAIVDFAISHACSMIVMGTHGHGSAAGLILGSVTAKVLNQSSVPVLLTK